MNPAEQNLKNEIDFLMKQCRVGAIGIHQLMKLIDIAYKDYLDFHPEERQKIYDPDVVERSIQSLRQFGPQRG